MTVAVENVGEAAARAGDIIESGTVLEDINRNADSVDLRDPQRRVPFRATRISVASIDALKRGTRIRDDLNRYVGRNRRGADQESAYGCNESKFCSAHRYFFSLTNQKIREPLFASGIVATGGVKNRRTIVGTPVVPLSPGPKDRRTAGGVC